MDFYDPETEQKTESERTDQKTDQLVTDFESKVESAYSEIENNAKLGWSSFNGFISNFQKKLPDYITETKELTKKIDLQKTISSTRENLEKNLKDINIPQLPKFKEEDLNEIKESSGKFVKNLNENTNKYLDELDSDLEKLENLTLDYASKFGSFLTTKTGLNLNFASTDAAGDKKDEILFNLPSGLASNRVEAQIYELQHNKDIYLTESKENEAAVKSFELTAEQKEESTKLLADIESLTTIHEELVPAEMEDELFWKIYFSGKNKIIEEERKRKELLEKKAAEDDEEDFDWDDDEEEDEAKPAKKDDDKTASALEA